MSLTFYFNAVVSYVTNEILRVFFKVTTQKSSLNHICTSYRNDRFPKLTQFGFFFICLKYQNLFDITNHLETTNSENVIKLMLTTIVSGTCI